jgi:UDP-glucuronate decarboxylase
LSKRVLVTGGAGFLGSHLCKRLLELGHQVIAADNLHTGSIKSIESLLRMKNFEFIEHDIREPIHVDIEQIYNLACPASPIHYQTDPVKTIQTNVHGMMNMLDLAKDIDAKILQASTSEVYGNPLMHPQKEGYWGNVNPIGLRSCYDEGKRCAETLLFDYHRQYDVKIKVARIFNTFGPNMAINDGRVVSNFILQALEDKPISIYGNGDQTRSFCFVDDLVEGLVLLMNSDDSFTGPINLGNPNEIQIKILAEKIIEMTNSSSIIEYKPLPEDDPVKRRPDISLAKEVLGWEPKINIAEGITKTISYFEEKFVF